MSDAMAKAMTDMAWAKNQGLDNAVQRSPQSSTPTSLREWGEEVLEPNVLGPVMRPTGGLRQATLVATATRRGRRGGDLRRFEPKLAEARGCAGMSHPFHRAATV
jgi:hypothetical protein